MPEAESKFIADAMLGSLARKLRILGFDTSYHKEGTDRELIRLATIEGRIILTSDRQLWNQHSSRLAVFLIGGRSDRERLLSLVGESKSHGIALVGRDSRCTLCNGVLRRSLKEELQGRVPDSVLKRHRSFNICTECGKVYWKGRHWSRLRRFSYLLPSKRI
jgi:uncharacterized protein with PIN domain